MVTFFETPTDAPIARELLGEYIAERVATRPASAEPYQPPQPTPAQFVPPHGIFLVGGEDALAIVAASAHSRGADQALCCGGIRAIEPGTEWVDDGFGGQRWFELKHLYTRPAARGRGIAGRLIAELTEAARRFGADRLVLDTHSSLSSAGHLYESAGFRAIPRFNDNSNADRWFGKAL
ncbi:GNAT family N-acetyltransferase [Gulosibacter molinativorax]|uniref:GNAT family N-acetyltransferase n=1 Tax=Gulosibacter molinativorax TaxID=256821 RepID=A0ABT7C3J8_9MICO|nr:GNAT family N-acetyltransferase [Gulosibacter molinativorax]MDJ1369831.1 GNAT family N-acetyltransferase [Gulosibacter molinativorax]QUY61796.1 PadR family transcriptional regulator [Gulosibacter molinativorax]